MRFDYDSKSRGIEFFFTEFCYVVLRFTTFSTPFFVEIHRALFPGVPWGPSRGSPGTLEAVKVSRAVLYRCLPIFTDFFGLSCENRVLSDDLVVGVLPEHYLVLGESEEEEVGEGWRKLEEVKTVGESLKS